MVFINRSTAGKQLAERLSQHYSIHSAQIKKTDVIVVGLARGGVPVALEIAQRFNCPLEVIVVKKLALPGEPEYAIGAVSSDGVVFVNPTIPTTAEWNRYIEQERERLLKQTQRAEREFYSIAAREKTTFEDKSVIVVDDGIATGMTARAAIESVRRRGASDVILATPVMSLDSYRDLRPFCDLIVALNIPDRFHSVGEHYTHFDQVNDQEVVDALRVGATLLVASEPPVQKS